MSSPSRKRINSPALDISSPPRKRIKLDSPTFSDLFLTDRFGPVREAFACHLSTVDLLQLARTCYLARDTINKLQWNINSKLRAFLGDPIAFRSRLAQCNALISGSFALQFLERVVWPESDLDIFVEDGPGSLSLCDYLSNEEGYSRGKDKGRIGYIDIDLKMVRRYTLYYTCHLHNTLCMTILPTLKLGIITSPGANT